jgi:hypothetical protein
MKDTAERKYITRIIHTLRLPLSNFKKNKTIDTPKI